MTATAGTRRPPDRRLRSGLLQNAGGQADLALGPELAGGNAARPDDLLYRRRRRQLVLRAHLTERPVQGAVEEVVDHATVAETHLVLGRVHVDVDHARIDLEEQHEGRVATVEQHVAVGLAHGMGDQLVAHHAAVDIEILQVGLAAREGRQTHPTP